MNGMQYDYASGRWMPANSSTQGQFSGVTIDNKPIDVEAYVREKSKPRVVRKAPQPFGGDRAPTTGAVGPEPVEQAQQIDTQKGVKDSAQSAAKTVADSIDEGNSQWANYQKAIAGANFIIDVMNANSAYQSAKGQAQLNIMQARNDEADALYRGRQAQLDRQSEGYNMGQTAALAMAAQGQDVAGNATSKISGSYEAMGYEAGAREMINAYREALGYELEIVNAEWQVDQAAIARDNAYIGATLQLGTTLAVL